METIGKIVYINLDKRPDRRAAIEHELERMGLTGERFSAIEVPQYGGVGCAMSHAFVVRTAANEGDSSLLVLEDDFVWKVQNREELDARLRPVLQVVPDYDVIMFDYCLDKDGGHIANSTGKVIESTCASGYLVAGHYLDRLATCLEEGAVLYSHNPTVHWLFINDVYWKRLQHEKWYYVKPRLGTQCDGFSDLAERFVK